MKENQLKSKVFQNVSLHRKSVSSGINLFPIVGNSAAVQFMNQKTDEHTIQRKLGLEFQTIGGNPNIEPIPGKKPDESESNILTVPQLFSITRDGKDLEYVTEAVDEKSDSDRLLFAVQTITSIHDSILKGSNVLVNRELKKKGLRIASNGQRDAHPQASIGVMLMSIPQLIERFLNADMFGATNLRAKTKGGQWEIHQEAFAKTRDVPEMTPSMGGFLHLLSQYIASNQYIVNNNFTVDYAKSYMPFMSRTSLYNLFMLLEENERREVYSIINENELYKERTIIKQGVNEKERGKNADIITTQNLLASIAPEGVGIGQVPGTDVMSTSNFEGVSLLYKDGYNDIPPKSLEKMREFQMNSPTDIGNNQNGAIMELRALERNVAPERWIELTRRILELVRTP